MNLKDYLIADNASELNHVLRMPNYRSFIRTLKTARGAYCFRVNNQQNQIVARSRSFDDKMERDSHLAAFITFIEVKIHGRLQMELF